MPLQADYIRSYLSAIRDKINVPILDIDRIVQNVYPKLKKINTVNDIDEQIIASASEMVADHYSYSKFATFLLVRNLHKSTNTDYGMVVQELLMNTDKHGKHKPILSTQFVDFVQAHRDRINSAFRYERDYETPLFGYRTLEKSYLKKNVYNKIIERPQHMFMRVAIAIHYRASYATIDQTLDKIFQTYNLLSEGFFTHATPTLFNSGTNNEQLASCLLMGIEDDMDEVGTCWKNTAISSKYGAGIGIHVTNLRCRGAYINSTQGKASGMGIATVFNAISRYAHQGGRPGSFALYIEPWHGDMMYFLDLRKNTGAETDRARDLFLGLTINDIFMERVESDGIWSLMCPSDCPDLLNKFGDEFTETYKRYESERKYLHQVPARDVWWKIIESQIETGVPYMLFKDATNKKSNQSNIGVINGSNLCVSGDTQILTSNGYYSIASLVNSEVSVWNGIEFSKTTIKQTGTNQSLTLIGFSNGSTLKCTSYHKFYIQKNNNEVVIKHASELFVGDQLVSVIYPIIIDPDTISKTNSTDVPVNQNLETKLLYLRQLIDKLHPQFINDDFGNIKQIKLEYNDKTYLTSLKYMLQTMGCDPDIKNIDYGMFVLILYQSDIMQLVELGLNFNFNPDTIPDINLGLDTTADKHVYIEYIYENVGTENTYCFNEPNRHMGIFNGIIAGNCIEIVEVSTSNEYASCFTADTEILTENGIKKIIDCDGEKVLSYFDTDTNLVKSQHYEEAKLIYNGKKIVYGVKTSGNKIINATSNHLFLVNIGTDKYQWKKLEDLQIGDKLMTPQTSTLQSHKIDISNFDKEYVTIGRMSTNMQMSVDGMDFYVGPIESYTQKITNVQSELWHHFKLAAPIKQASFLSGYYSAHGYITQTNNVPTINLTSDSEQILYDVQSMLTPFGISSKISFDEPKCVPGQYLLSIYGTKNINRFRKYIGLELSLVKQEELNACTAAYGKQKIKFENYSQIVSIEEIGEKDVYDLSLEHSHNFIANGHIVHNCNLASICLPKFFESDPTPSFSYQKLYQMARIITRNLNNMIDVSFYPLDKTEISNMKHRPIGIGVQGLADLFMLFKIPFDSEQAKDINRRVFETIYFGFLSESNDLAKEFGPYETFKGSPLSKGQFQFDLWGVTPSGMWDWDSLRTSIVTYGVRNSLGTTAMPTASTSLIMGNHETCEPITSNIYTRGTMSGDYYVPNKYLMDDLIKLGLWNSDMIDLIKYYEGSIQHIDFIPDNIKQIYRTVWEIEQKSIVEMAAGRAPYLDQTQSMNIFMAKNKFYPPDHYSNQPLNARLSSSHFAAWKAGLKTGIYYLRTKPASEANQFGIDINKIKELETKYKLADILTTDPDSEDNEDNSTMVCELRPSGLADGEVCVMCSS